MVTDDKLPSLSSIRAFECAARAGSFAQAATELGTTAASVSYHVRQLEAQLGLPLFHRHAQRVELTATGAVIAREAMNAFAALRASFVRAVDVDESRLALTTLPTLRHELAHAKARRVPQASPADRASPRRFRRRAKISTTAVSMPPFAMVTAAGRACAQ